MAPLLKSNDRVSVTISYNYYNTYTHTLHTEHTYIHTSIRTYGTLCCIESFAKPNARSKAKAKTKKVDAKLLLQIVYGFTVFQC